MFPAMRRWPRPHYRTHPGARAIKVISPDGMIARATSSRAKATTLRRPTPPTDAAEHKASRRWRSNPQPPVSPLSSSVNCQDLRTSFRSSGFRLRSLPAFNSGSSLNLIGSDGGNDGVGVAQWKSGFYAREISACTAGDWSTVSRESLRSTPMNRILRDCPAIKHMTGTGVHACVSPGADWWDKIVDLVTGRGPASIGHFHLESSDVRSCQ